MSKKTLATKLAKQVGNEIQKLRSPTKMPDMDIEECANSLYFSPVQTRRQRKTKLESVHEGPKKGRKLAGSTAIVKDENESTISTIHLKEEEKHKKKSHSPKKTDNTNLWEPNNWRQILENIREMRRNSSAPVDTMGCHKCADDTADEKTQRFQKLIALMLSSQTKDETTFDAMQRLKNYGLTPETVASIETPKLEELLKPVSFYKNKAKYLKQTSQILIDKYDMDIPNNIKDLVGLPGVGPKMAHICMATAWKEITGIGVDVHVHRISNRLQWVPKPTKEPEQTRIALESWLPHDLWHEVNCLLVGFGQMICTPTRPHCADCLNSDICPAADKTVKKQKITTANNSPIQKFKYQRKKINL